MHAPRILWFIGACLGCLLLVIPISLAFSHVGHVRGRFIDLSLQNPTKVSAALLECAKQLALLEQSNLELMLKHIHPYDLEALALAITALEAEEITNSCGSQLVPRVKTTSTRSMTSKNAKKPEKPSELEEAAEADGEGAIAEMQSISNDVESIVQSCRAFGAEFRVVPGPPQKMTAFARLSAAPYHARLAPSPVALFAAAPSPVARPTLARQSETGQRSDVPVGTVAVGTALIAGHSRARAGRVHRYARMGRRHLVLQATGSSTEDPEALAKEAAKLRAEVAQLEAEQEEARRKERQALFRILDTDSSGALDAKELQKGIKDVMGADVDDATAERLVKSLDLNGDGIIQPEELDFDAVQRLLREFRKELQDKEEAEKTAAYATTEEEMLRKEWEHLPEDTGLLTRAGSFAAYLLPLTDALRFGLFLFAAFPFVQPLLNFLVLPALLINALPFGLGYLALFFVMQGLASNKELPALLRYNLRQAITLDARLQTMRASPGTSPRALVFFPKWLNSRSLTPRPASLGCSREIRTEAACFLVATMSHCYDEDGNEDTSKFFDRLFKERENQKGDK
eukprot:g27168.t1